MAHVIFIRQINNSLYQNHVHVATHISYPSRQVSYLPNAITRLMWDNVGARLSKSITACTLSGGFRGGKGGVNAPPFGG